MKQLRSGLENVLEDAERQLIEAIDFTNHTNEKALRLTCEYFQNSFGGTIEQVVDDETPELMQCSISIGFGYVQFGNGGQWVFKPKKEFEIMFHKKYCEILENLLAEEQANEL